jgi:hypothetical protein
MNLSGLGYPDQQRVPVGWQWPTGIKRLERPRWPQSERLHQLAQAVPTLDQQFAATRSLVDSISGRNLITFSRAGGAGATYVDRDLILKTAEANAPRFDHNPITGESLGLLVEEQRTNLLLQSENLGTTWTLFATTSSLNTAIAPDGQTTADTVIPNNGAIGNARQELSVPDSTIYTFSVFLKTNGLNSLNLQFYNKANTFHGSKNLDLSTGVLSGVEYIGVTSVVAYGNGWYRLILANLGSGTGATTPNVRIVTATTGNGTSGFYIWGAQLEAGAFATSYIPTTTAAATRAADFATITGTAFSSWYRQDEGTVFAEGSISNTSSNKFPVGINDGTSNEEIGLYWNTAFNGLVNDNGVVQGNSFGGSVTTNSRLLHAFGYKLNDARGYGNGTALGALTSITMPTTNRMNIGRRDDSSFWLNGTIRRITFWPARLPNTTLQRMTQ